jgi:hypothetical protein
VVLLTFAVAALVVPLHANPANASTSPAVKVVAGNFTCVLHQDQTISCQGFNAHGESTPPSGYFTDVATGFFGGCAIKASDQTVTCWGSDSYGLLNPPPGTFTSVSAQAWDACGIRTDQTLACWGEYSPDESNVPSGTFVTVAAGAGHACAIRTDNTLACWGNDTYGQADPPPGTYQSVSTGDATSCAVSTAGSLTCWGNEPVAPTPDDYSQVSASIYDWYCGLRTDGNLDCGGSPPTGTPTGPFTAVEVAGLNGCALRADGTYACWGDNSEGQLFAIAPTIQPLQITVQGAYADGYQLNAGGFNFTGVPTPGITVQWQRCLPVTPSPTSSPVCSDISGATQLSYTLTTADVSRQIRVVATASNTAGTATATSSLTPIIGPTYTFAGFFNPVANIPTVNIVKNGQVVPLDWRLTTPEGLAVASPGSFTGATIESRPCSPSDPTSTLSKTKTDSGLQYLGNGNWQYGWSPSKAQRGTCVAVSLHYADPTIVPTAYFQVT